VSESKIKVTAERREPMDTETYSMVIWLQSKRRLRERREREEIAKRRRTQRQEKRGER